MTMRVTLCLVYLNIPRLRVSQSFAEFARQLDNELNQVDVEVEIVVENSDNLQVQSRDGESAENVPKKPLLTMSVLLRNSAKELMTQVNSLLWCEGLPISQDA